MFDTLKLMDNSVIFVINLKTAIKNKRGSRHAPLSLRFSSATVLVSVRTLSVAAYMSLWWVSVLGSSRLPCTYCKTSTTHMPAQKQELNNRPVIMNNFHHPSIRQSTTGVFTCCRACYNLRQTHIFMFFVLITVENINKLNLKHYGTDEQQILTLLLLSHITDK